MVISNLKKYSTDLDELLAKSGMVNISLNYEAFGHAKFHKAYADKFSAEKADDLIKEIKPFREVYQHWYSEALPLVRQLLPDRFSDFVRLYEKPKSRKQIDFESYRLEDACQGLRTSQGGTVKADASSAIPLLAQQIAIVEAIKRRFVSSLFDIKQLVQADLFDSELAGAKELLKNKFSRAAGAIAGVVLEGHLKVVCDNHQLPKKSGTISVLNDALKAAGVIELVQYRHIQFLGDVRNKCSHKNLDEPSFGDVEDLIQGVDKVIKTIF
ncbi:hypothetical protein CCL16_17290 [Pseudomonas syringae]|uniref:hypothetical protein n=1 Tax=Pseudomonas TaxID=286 RepID=UPI000BB62890|nr:MULTISPECIES: hypothetical protein [Pseudomonas]PBP83433.1 hypothetical protein CCL16_17290 [Pseudomonas syringae]